MHIVIPYVVAALLFALGVYGVLRRRNAILVLMAVELMLNAVNLIFVAADASVRPGLVGVQPEAWSHVRTEPPAGAIFALFAIVLAAAEVGVGLAIVLQFYRMRKEVAIDEVALHEADQELQDERRQDEQQRQDQSNGQAPEQVTT